MGASNVAVVAAKIKLKLKPQARMKKFLLLLLLAAGAEAVVGQADPFSRWSVGMETGISLVPQNRFYQSTSNHAAPTTLQGQYQIFRWLAFPIQLSHSQISYYRNGVNLWKPNPRSDRSAYDMSYKMQHWSLSVGPKLIIRLRHSHIGLSLRHGLARSIMKQKVQNFGLAPLQIDYKPNRSELRAWRLSYTYKPVEYLAVELSVEQLYISPTERFATVQDLEDLFPNMPEYNRNALVPRTINATSLNAVFGIHYLLP